jgi:hypothetical protein
MIKEDVNLLFYIENIQDFGGNESSENILGVYNDFNDAKEAMQDALMDNCYRIYNKMDVAEDVHGLKDLLSASYSSNDFAVVAAEQGVPLSYANRTRVFSAMLTDDKNDPIVYYGIGELGLSYDSNEKRIQTMKDRISMEFEGSNPNINLTKNLQETVDECRKKKIFIENIVENKDELIHVSKNAMKIMENTSANFIKDLDSHLMEYDKNLFEKIKGEINSNKNSGAMKEAFEKAKKNKI